MSTRQDAPAIETSDAETAASADNATLERPKQRARKPMESRLEGTDWDVEYIPRRMESREECAGDIED